MAICPSCKADLTDEAVERGVCPKCHALLGDYDVIQEVGQVQDDLLEVRQPPPQVDDADDTETQTRLAQSNVPQNVSTIWDQAVGKDTLAGATIRAPEQGMALASHLNLRSMVITRAVTGDIGLKPPPHPPDYELWTQLGEGGMGVVYQAKQASLDRDVALKVIKLKTSDTERSRAKFLSESAVTAHLDHPNIVPVYDLGMTDDGTLFYSMKRVQGTSWQKILHTTKQEDARELSYHLDLLTHICDAVAFAHSKGVIHRDIKPENVMIGEYGMVMLMDWGMAVSVLPGAKAEPITQKNAFGGTPSYMAPEMAMGDPLKISARSDIYLLGAVLYEICTGRPPHPGKDATKALRAAANNIIRPTSMKGDLIKIALRAMSTNPEDRFMTVKEFQQAIMNCMEHAQSMALMQKAAETFAKARKQRDYELFSKSVVGFEAAVESWKGNEMARRNIILARREYALCAVEKGDLEMASSLIVRDDPAFTEVIRRMVSARAERMARTKRSKSIQNLAIGMGASLIVALGIAIVIAKGLLNHAEEETQKINKKLAIREKTDIAKKTEQRQFAPIYLSAARQMAREAGNSQQIGEALALAQTSAEADSELPDAQMLIAQLRIIRREYADALAALDQYTAMGGSNPALAARLTGLCGDGVRSDTPQLILQFAEALRKDEPKLAAQLDRSGEEIIAGYRRVLDSSWRNVKYSSRLTRTADGKLSLDLSETQVQDLKPIKNFKISKLNLSGTPVKSIEDLAGMPLEFLDVRRTQVRDLQPLENMKLQTLVFDTIKEYPRLDVVKNMSSLKQIGTSPEKLLTPAEFWRKFYAGTLESPR
ncbi:MAG: protein kinase [Planctomycetes bacterium]|nr:protein kinase [Planctomycetota bacterium]